MGKLTIDLPYDVIAAAREQMGDGLNRYLQEALESAIRPVAADEELIALLDEGKASPAAPLTDADLSRWLRLAEDAAGQG